MVKITHLLEATKAKGTALHTPIRVERILLSKKGQEATQLHHFIEAREDFLP